MNNITDKLIERIKTLQNPSVAGLDTSLDYLPDEMKKHVATLEDAGKAVTEFNAELIEALYPIVPAVKVQAAYYEMYGVAGMQAFADTLKLAKRRGLFVIADVKRNDIGSTAACYSKAYLGKVKVGEREVTPFDSDFITVNGYLGSDGIKPFIEDCRLFDKGIFVLVKTSNPASAELQDRRLQQGGTLYETVGRLVEDLGAGTVGTSGYGAVGAVVGATHPEQAAILRRLLPHTFFLVPGYGAQGATAADLAVCFDEHKTGAIVNSSRGIICAYRQPRYAGLSFKRAAAAAATDMREDLAKGIGL